MADIGISRLCAIINRALMVLINFVATIYVCSCTATFNCSHAINTYTCLIYNLSIYNVFKIPFPFVFC